MIVPVRRPAALLLVAAAFAVSAPAAVYAAESSHARSVTVQGHGEVRVAPDEAELSMSARTTDKNLRAAEKEVDAIVRRYVAKARSLGIAGDDLSTAGYTVQPQYDYSSKEGRTFRGYEVTRNIRLTVRDLDKVGDYLEAATAAGINQIASPVLQSSKAPQYRLQALAKAARDAHDQARTLAQALNMHLGPAHTVETMQAPSPRPMVMRAMAAPSSETAADGNERMGFTAGLVDYKASVRASFDLKPRARASGGATS